MQDWALHWTEPKQPSSHHHTINTQTNPCLYKVLHALLDIHSYYIIETVVWRWMYTLQRDRSSQHCLLDTHTVMDKKQKQKQQVAQSASVIYRQTSQKKWQRKLLSPLNVTRHIFALNHTPYTRPLTPSQLHERTLTLNEQHNKLKPYKAQHNRTQSHPPGMNVLVWKSDRYSMGFCVSVGFCGGEMEKEGKASAFWMEDFSKNNLRITTLRNIYSYTVTNIQQNGALHSSATV